MLTEEQREFAKSIDDFCAREVGGVEKRRELTTEGGTHSPHIYSKMAELGWLGLTVPEEYGGSDAGAVELCLLLEHSLRGLAPIGGIGPTLITAAAYQKFGTEEQRKRALELVVNGGTLCISMSEPGAGSDVAALRCKAERDGDNWVINGQKTWCSNAHFADRILLVARTDSSGKKHEGITMFDVPADIEGLQITGIETMGGMEVNDLYFTDVRLPADSVIGEVGGGWAQLMTGLNTERLILAARKVDEADPTALFPREASMAKLKASELSKRVTLECMQSMGGYGYATEYGMERLVRQAVVSTIYGGTNEVQRDIIGKTLGL
ncbi:acyl-CoA/acyl-ACP dehydrogenase [Dietzia sp. SL131]|uniref:acyl-CoA dehydrogenase family protein n=1 Tax=Dietzia sp. SL131 TaxID=2995149 RepID=UPI00227B0278|nr:acyl-CoA dehydrogenase family protein [Dietzia sp. SL131]MCY1658742.1 acyl-CoA/acyl-ACP dehydrogenase [Dietzia sp. SL131]